eukprot:gene9666-20096_t
MGRRPNAGGGKHNHNNNDGPARARFSNWKPASKNVRSKFESQRELRPEGESGKSEMSKTKSTHGGLSFGKPFPNSSSASDNEKILASIDIPKLIEISVPSTVLSILSAMISAEIKTGISNGSVSLAEKCSSIKISDTTSQRPPSSKSVTYEKPTVSSADQQIINTFQSIGFSSAEIAEAMSATANAMNQEEIYLNLLSIICEKINIINVIEPLNSKNTDTNSNIELLEEIESLSSIFEGNVTHYNSILNGYICHIIDITLQQNQYTKNPKNDINIHFIIKNSHIYPSIGSCMFGWATVGEPTNNSHITYDLLRSLSIDAMRHVRSIAPGAPVAFDFIQIVQSNIPPPPIPPSRVMSLSASATATSQKSTKDKSTKVVVGTSASSVTPPPPPVPQFPLRKLTESPEYRMAFGRALGEGLIGQAARNKAHVYLDDILPQSTIAAIILEEEALEAAKNKSFSMTAWGTKGDIECTKHILHHLPLLNKAQAKSLLTVAKKLLSEKGDDVARDEVTLRNRMVTAAVETHQKRLLEKEAKRKLRVEGFDGGGGGGGGSGSGRGGGGSRGQRQRQRGPTLRDAKIIADDILQQSAGNRNRIASDINDMEEDDADSDYDD